MTSRSPILKNIFSIGSARALSLLFPLLILPYLINTIGIDKYGIIIFALSFVAYFNTFVDFSFNVTAVRSISSQAQSQDIVNTVVSEVLHTKLFLLLVSIVMGSGIIFFVPTFNTEISIFLIVFSSLIGYSLSPEWFFIGREKMEYIAVLMISFKALHAGSIFLFISSPGDSWIYAVILSTEQFLLAITGLLIMRWKFKVRIQRFQFSKVKAHLRKNKALFINQLLPNLYNNTTTLLLGFFAGPGITGTYGVLRKITNLGESVLRIISRVFFPAINRDISNTESFRRLQWALTFIVVLSIAIAAPFVHYLFEGFEHTVTLPLIILGFGIFGLTLYDIYGYNFFLVNHQDKLVLKNTLIFSLIGFTIAIPTIYYSGLIGAALVVALTRLAIGGRLFILYKSSISL